MGDGGTTNGINENNTMTNWHGLLSIHMPAYYNSIIEGVSTVMVSYSSWNGVKMHANRDLVTRFLKDTLKFRVNITIYEEKKTLLTNCWIITCYYPIKNMTPPCSLYVS